MEWGSLTIWRIQNVPLRIHLSVLFGIAFMGLYLNLHFARSYSGWSQEQQFLASAIGALFIWVCVLAHELGHFVVLRDLKRPVDNITLFALGAYVSPSDSEENTWRRDKAGEEIVISVAGPLVNIIIAALLLLGFYVPSEDTAFLSGLLQAGIRINLLLGLFSLLPLVFCDGGRIIYDVFAWLTNSEKIGLVAYVLGWIATIGAFIAGFRMLP